MAKRAVMATVMATALAFMRPAAAETLNGASPQVPPRLHSGGAPVVTLSDPSSIEPFLDGYAAALMADQYPPGMMVAVATQDAVFVKAYGLANAETGEAAKTSTLFRIASISKTFVWTAVMMLIDEGKLDLNTDVNVYLKNVKVKPAFNRAVTLEDLMAHRPGFEDTVGDFFQAGKGRTFEQALDRTRPARVAPPGERTAYSNWGTGLAAQIVADVSGVPFDEFVSTRILAPVGMVSTLQHDPASIADKALNNPALDARLAAPHRLEAGAPAAMRHDALDPLHAAGAIALDAQDAGRWLQFLLRGGVAGDQRLLSPESFARLRTRAFRDRAAAPDFARGFMETEIAGTTTFGHGGTLSGFIADMTIAPSLGLGVFVVVNGAEGQRIPDLVSRAVIEKFAGAETYPTSWKVEATDTMKEAANDVAGVYVNNRRVFTRLEKIASAGSDIKITAREDGSLAVAAGDRVKRYYPLQEDVWSDRGRDRLFAYRDKNGAVQRISLSMGTSTADRVGLLQSSDALNLGVGVVGLTSMLALLGAWRRQGRDVATTGLGKWLSLGHAVVAFFWLVFIGVIAWVSVDLASKELADMQEEGWPPASMVALIVSGHLAALGALAAAVGMAPVLIGSGWSIWRRIHFAFFAASGLFAVWLLWNWRLILAPWSN